VISNDCDFEKVFVPKFNFLFSLLNLEVSDFGTYAFKDGGGGGNRTHVRKTFQ